MNKFFIATMLLLVQCNLFPPDRPQIPEFFRDDISSGESELSQNLKELLKKPVPAGMSEQAILDYSGNPRPRRWSSVKPVQKHLNGKSFQFDRIVSFIQVETRSLDRKTDGMTVTGSVMRERIEIVFFLYKVVAVYQTVTHLIRDDKKKKWLRGPLRTNYGRKDRESWSGSLKDGTIYWMQRPDGKPKSKIRYRPPAGGGGGYADHLHLNIISPRGNLLNTPQTRERYPGIQDQWCEVL